MSGQLLELFGENVVSEEAIDPVPFLSVLGKDSSSLHVSENLVGGVLVVAGLVLPKTVVVPPVLRRLFLLNKVLYRSVHVALFSPDEMNLLWRLSILLTELNCNVNLR